MRYLDLHRTFAPVVVVTLSTLLVGCGGDDDPTGPSEPGPEPTLSSVEPSSGTVGTELRIDGTDFRSGIEVLVEGISADGVDRASSTQVFALVPSGITFDQALDVTVRNGDGTEATSAGAFTAVAPELEFVNSATKPSGQEGSTVVLDGDAFGDRQGDGRVLFSDGAGGTIEAAVESEDDWTNTFILTTVPSGAETGDVVVETASGASDGIEFTVTENATFSPSQVDWTQTTDLPVGLSGHAAAYVPVDDEGVTVRYVHVTGGAPNDSVPSGDVNFAEIQSDGSLGAWSGTSSLSTSRAFHAPAAATPFNSRVQGDGWIYALGGIDAKGGDPVTGVERAEINADGSLGSWESAGDLPEPLHSLQAVVFRSSIYVAGGSTTGDEAVPSVYRAAVDTLGQIGEWESLQSLPAARSHHELTVLGNCLHVFGGDSASVTPNDETVTGTRYISIARSRVDLRSGGLTSDGWTTDDTEPAKARAKQAGLIAGGGILLNAGLYDGIGTLGSSENAFAQIGADCDVADFGGANNNNSIASKGGGNLFNHAGISFVDGSGVAHVMILGGDDVDLPGNKRQAVWFY